MAENLRDFGGVIDLFDPCRKRTDNDSHMAWYSRDNVTFASTALTPFRTPSFHDNLLPSIISPLPNIPTTPNRRCSTPEIRLNPKDLLDWALALAVPPKQRLSSSQVQSHTRLRYVYNATRPQLRKLRDRVTDQLCRDNRNGRRRSYSYPYGGLGRENP